MDMGKKSVVFIYKIHSYDYYRANECFADINFYLPGGLPARHFACFIGFMATLAKFRRLW